MLPLLLISLFSAVQVHAAPSFEAKNLLTQKNVSFPSAKAKATVVVFLSAQCPCSESHEKKLAELSEKYSKEGFEFVGVHSNQNEKADESKEHFQASALPFPVVEDRGAKIADELKALKTPHAFILQNGKVVYEGGVDDSADASESKVQFLANALAEVKEQKPITVAKARALGCQIKR